MKWLSFLLVVAASFLLGRCTASWWSSAATPEPDQAVAADKKPIVWTCSMDPQIKRPNKGKCPICGMDLVPQRTDDLGPREVAMSPAARKLAEIETALVKRKFLTMPVRLVGKIDYDETAVRTIAARVPGRIDRMYVDYTGVSVKKGDHLVWLYSPPLLTAQEELLEAKKRLKTTAREVSAFLRESNKRAYRSARDKLLLWGLTEAQVDAIEQRGAAEDHILIQSPNRGVIIDKILSEGDYVTEGSKVYRIADLDRLWLRLDAYEQDLPWLRYGQQVSVQAEAVPGEVFQGWISFIDPVLHERTRTVKVRVNISNPLGKLKPGMFVRAVVRSRIAGAGRVLASRLAGKWISPMHPEIVKDGPGKCDICGMDLVPASELGYVAKAEVEKPLVVPASAVLLTGKRAVVYVEVMGKKRPTFEGREIILGPRAGDDYIVRAGLRENERIVVNGAFRIDSSMQILGKPSMLSVRGESALFTGPDTALFRMSLGSVYQTYFDLQESLAADDLARARTAVRSLQVALRAVEPAGIPLVADQLWHEEAGVMAAAVDDALAAESLESLRVSFDKLSQSAISLERAFRHPADTMHFETFCPMAFDNRGAAWLQMSEEITNPYLGKAMLSCGEVRDRFLGVQTLVRKVDERGKGIDATAPAGLAAVFDGYFALQTALAMDDLKGALGGAARLMSALAAADREQLPPSIAGAWGEATRAAARAAKASSLEALRVEFDAISKAVITMHPVTGHPGPRVFYRMHCPMAFDNKGADWLQTDKVVRNPYFGASMLRCGRIEQTLPAKKAR